MTHPIDTLLPLADLGSVPAPPAWFTDALAQPGEPHGVEVDGIRIEARSWGRADAPGLLFVHGNAAHHGWWSFLAPFFAHEFHVVTFSLGGMGGSGWRDNYSSAAFAREMWAVADATGLTAGPMAPIIVAHSMGGLPLIHSAAVMDRPIRAGILVDVGLPGEQMISVGDYNHHRLYPSEEAALGRFRLSPPQPCANGWIAEYLARGGIREQIDADGERTWTWRFDPRLWKQIDAGDIWGDLARVHCPMAIIRGEHSILTRGAMHARFMATLSPDTPDIEIPDAYHHVMVDQPIATVAAIRALIAGWNKR
jgi:pimeloyl-ACP methyl ester carboxylesterase